MPRMDSMEWDEMLYDKYTMEDEPWYFLFDPNEKPGLGEDEYNACEGNKILYVTVSFDPETRVIKDFSTVCQTDRSQSSHLRPVVDDRELMVYEQKEYLNYLSSKITNDPTVLQESRKKWMQAEEERKVKQEEQKRLAAIEHEKSRIEQERKEREFEEYVKKYRSGEIPPAGKEKTEEFCSLINESILNGRARDTKRLTEQAIAEGVNGAYLRERFCSEVPKALFRQYDKGEIFIPDLLVALRAINYFMGTIEPFELRNHENDPCAVIFRLSFPYNPATVAITRIIKEMLNVAGYNAIIYEDCLEPDELLRSLTQDEPDLILLNTGFPDSWDRVNHPWMRAYEDGYIEVMKENSKVYNIPMVMIGTYVKKDDPFLQFPNSRSVEGIEGVLNLIDEMQKAYSSAK